MKDSALNELEVGNVGMAIIPTITIAKLIRVSILKITPQNIIVVPYSDEYEKREYRISPAKFCKGR